MEFVTFEIAKKLKEKGFREKCFATYTPYSETLKLNEINTDKRPAYYILNIEEFRECYNYYEDNNIDTPTISQALKWLREEKKLHIEPCVLADSDTDADNKIINEYTYWSFSIVSIETGDMIYFEYEHIDDKRFDTFESAVLVGIEYTLDNLI